MRIILTIIISLMVFFGSPSFADTIDLVTINQRVAALEQQIQEKQDTIKHLQSVIAVLEEEKGKFLQLKQKVEAVNTELLKVK